MTTDYLPTTDDCVIVAYCFCIHHIHTRTFVVNNISLTECKYLN